MRNELHRFSDYMTIAGKSSNLRYPICVEGKWELLEKAEKTQVELGSRFESVRHPVRASLERFGYQQGTCPVAERTTEKVVNLPLHPRVSLKEAKCAVQIISTQAQKSPRISSSAPPRILCGPGGCVQDIGGLKPL